VYQVLDQIEFKAGEKIRLDNPDKVLLARMQDLTPPAPADEASPAKPAAKKPAAKPRKGTRKK
jgi:hypothetical protein